MNSAAMLRRSVLSRNRGFSSESRKVAILGQPLSLLMKLNPLVSSHDISADVSHINTRRSKANGGREGINTWAYKNTNHLIKATLEKKSNPFHTLAHLFFHSEGKNSVQVPFTTSNKKRYVSGVSQKERSPQARATNICIKLKSYDQPFLENWELPPSSKQIGLPQSRVLYTVLRSPHIDKKSREQFEMRIKKMVIKTETNELRKKLFWLKRQRIFGAQCEILISCKTRLDKGKLQSLL